MKRKLSILLFIAIFLLTLTLPLIAFALPTQSDPLPALLPVDVGNFNSYSDSSSGGSSSSSSSSWGSSSSGSSSSSSSSWGSSSSGSSSSSSSSRHSSSSSSSSRSYGSYGSSSSSIIIQYLPIIVVIIVLIAMVVKKYTKKENHVEQQDSGVSNSRGPHVADNTQAILEALVPKDPQFDGDRFISWAKDVFVALQTAWMERDWAKVRLFESESLYRQHTMQLQEYCNLGRINVIENIHFKRSYLQQYILESEYEYLVVYFDVNMIDYIKDEKTDQVIKGRRSESCNMRYLYTFMRKRGVLTDPEKSGKLSNCPHCGASITVTASEQCEYCGYIVTTGACDWVLSDIRGLRPDESLYNSAVFYR